LLPHALAFYHLKLVRLPIPPPPQAANDAIDYFFAGAGPGWTGAEFRAGALFRSGNELTPDPLVATMDNEIDVSINKIADIVVAFESNVADPRGPKAV
jgi:hypothetical protein